MNKILKKRNLIIFTIIGLITLGISTVLAQGTLSLSSILDDTRNHLDTFLSRDYSYYYNKKVSVDVEEAIWEKDLTCFAHWYKSMEEDSKVIGNVIDLNLDEANSIKVNGEKYTGENEYLFQALAKATSEGYNYDNYYNTAQDAATGKLIWELINSGNISGFDGTTPAYGSNSPEKNWQEYYQECIDYGREVVKNSSSGEVSCDKYNKDLIESQVVDKSAYLGPFQYSYTGEGNVAFSDIEIIGDENFSEKIEDLNDRLFVKAKNGFTSVSNGSIEPDTDFYILTNSNVDNSSKINVKINIKGSSCLKSRVLLLRAKNGSGGQSLAAYSTGAGKQEKSSQSLEYEFENHKGDLVIQKTGANQGKDVNAVENMGFKLYKLENNAKQYLKISTDTQLINDKLIGDVKVKKQETTNSNEATVVYTNSNGHLALLGIDTRYEYYLEEISDSSDYSHNIIDAKQLLEGKETNIFNNGVIGPIAVKKRSISKVTTVTVRDDIKRGNLKILKQDSKTGKGLQNVEFKIKTQSGSWVVASGTNGSYSLKDYNDYSKNKEYYKENFTTDEAKATTFKTNDKGEIYIKGLDKGTFILKETANNNYGYYSYEGVIISDATVDGEKAKISGNEITIVTKGDDKSTTETIISAKNERQVGTLKLQKTDKDTGKALENIEFNVQRYNEQTKKYEYIIVSKNDYIAGEDFDAGKSSVKIGDTTRQNTAKGKFTVGSMKFTENKAEATTFITDSNGNIEIENILIGKYKVNEISVGTNYGYTPYDDRTAIDKEYVEWIDAEGKEHSLAKEDIVLDVTKSSEATLKIKNIMKYLNITGKVWEDMLGGKDNTYEANGKDIYTDGDTLVEGMTVRLKDKDGNIIKTTTTGKNGEYEFKDVLIKDLGKYYVEFEYNGLTYTSVATLVGNDSSVNSKAGEVVEQRKKLNSAFTEITNKDSISDRSHGYSRDASGNVTGTISYRNDTQNWQSIFQDTTYNTNLTANTDVSGYSLNNEYTNKHYITRADGSYEIQNVNLGILKREQPQIAISNDIEKVEVDVNGYSHTYLYAQRNSRVQDTSAFNVGVKFGREYISGYTRAVYPSDVQFSATEAKDDDARKLKVYVTYATTIRNMSNNLKASVNELVNYYDKEYTIVDSWVGDNEANKVSWTNTSKYGQTYNDGNYIGAYTTTLAGTKINAGENLKVYIRFQVSDKAVLGLLNETSTLHNTSEIYTYSTYYGSNIEGCSTGDIYAGIDRVSAPGNAKPGDKATYEADTDDAPSLLLEAKGIRELAGTVFEDATASELQSGKERKGTGIYEDGENTVSGVTVDLLKASNGAVATVYPPADTDTGAGTNVSTAKSGEPATMVTGANGEYIFRGIEPDTYLIRYTYANGTTKVFDTTGKEVKDVTVQDYKSTIITSNEIKQAFEDNDKHLDWYKTTETQGRYSDARDDYSARQAIDNELTTLDGTSTPTITSLVANSPRFVIGVEKESIYTASTGDRYTALTENLDFGLVERPRQSATLDKEVAYLKVTLPNGQVLIDGDPRTGKLDYVTVTKDATGKVQEIYITIDSELIYGSQVEIKYDFTLANTSELDYSNESYYYYGDSKENPVKFTSATLIDYVDSDITLKAGQEGTWKALDIAEKGYNWNLTPEQEQQILKNYSTLVKAEPLSKDTAIAAGESKTTAIIVEKLLANSDELTYENNGEVVKIGKTGGRTMTTKLGSYATLLAANPEANPADGETDESKSAAVTIIPPTGSTDNTVTYAIIGAASLVVLAAGIFGTRKFLKK